MENEKKDTIVQELELPHESLFLALAYLPLYELLVMSRVCRSFRDALSEDVLPWRNILVGKPLNTRLTNDHLLKVTSKAYGRLRTLALLNCTKITDDGLQQVVACNPYISKVCILLKQKTDFTGAIRSSRNSISKYQLYVPGCTALTPDGIIKAVKLLTRSDHGLKSIRVNGTYNMRKEDLEILQHLMEENQMQQKGTKLYHEFKKLTILKLKETSPSIDMELCPKCNEVRVVFDCPRNSCKRMRHLQQQQRQEIECRGCRYCIPRCEECGICIKDEEEPEEAACPDSLCLGCWLQLPKCSFCNKPYCSDHADQQCSLPGSSGFVCTPCHVKFVENS